MMPGTEPRAVASVEGKHTGHLHIVAKGFHGKTEAGGTVADVGKLTIGTPAFPARFQIARSFVGTAIRERRASVPTEGKLEPSADRCVSDGPAFGREETLSLLQRVALLHAKQVSIWPCPDPYGAGPRTKETQRTAPQAIAPQEPHGIPAVPLHEKFSNHIEAVHYSRQASDSPPANSSRANESSYEPLPHVAPPREANSGKPCMWNWNRMEQKWGRGGL